MSQKNPKSNTKNSIYFNLIKNKNPQSYLYLKRNLFEWPYITLNNYLELPNLFKLKPFLISRIEDILLLNNISTNNVWKNNRWLYKFSLLNTHVTNSFHKLAEQKLLINQKPLTEQFFNFNLWFKNIKKLTDQKKLNLDLLYSSLDATLNTKSNLSLILNNSNYTVLKNLTFIESSLSFFYKRSYLFNSIYSNIYFKTSTKLNFVEVDENIWHLNSINTYVFKSINSSFLNRNTTANSSLSVTLDNDFNLMFYIILFDTAFGYNSLTNNSCIIDFKSYQYKYDLKFVKIQYAEV